MFKLPNALEAIFAGFARSRTATAESPTHGKQGETAANQRYKILGPLPPAQDTNQEKPAVMMLLD